MKSQCNAIADKLFLYLKVMTAALANDKMLVVIEE